MDKIELKNISEKYTTENGLNLNPDGKIVDMVLEGLLRNEEKYGALYCPCRLPGGDKEKDKAIICPCVYHKDEIAKDGHCKCRLFVSKT